MRYEELRAWCHGEMRAASDTAIHKRAAAILKLLDVATMPPWLADAAEALGEVRHEDGAPLALNWTQVIEAIRELREDRDAWKEQHENALACWRSDVAQLVAARDEAAARSESAELGCEIANWLRSLNEFVAKHTGNA